MGIEMMKSLNYRKCVAMLLMVAAMGLSTGCDSELEREAGLQVGVRSSADVQVSGNTVTVKRGTPVEFLFDGDPDFITFFSGEGGRRYEYRNRTVVDPVEVVSSRLEFSVWLQYGNGRTAAGALSMFISDGFGGLYKNDFERDSVLVEGFDWDDLVPQDSLPQAPGSAGSAKSFDLDLRGYLGRVFTLAIRYRPLDNSAAQPRVNFAGMVIRNRMADGSESCLYAGDFGFTAVNMCCGLGLSDQAGMTVGRSYGTVTNNVSGVWNLVNAGSGGFFIHSSGAGSGLKYSWLVSDGVLTNGCSPDVGVGIKGIAESLGSYSYVYEDVGTYRAVFLGRNANFRGESEVVREWTVRVVE